MTREAGIAAAEAKNNRHVSEWTRKAKALVVQMLDSVGDQPFTCEEARAFAAAKGLVTASTYGWGGVFRSLAKDGEIEKVGTQSAQNASSHNDHMQVWRRARTTDERRDDDAVDRFAEALRAKMAKSRAKGRGGWWDPEDTSHGYMLRALHHHIDKGDPLDVALFAMFLHHHGWATCAPAGMLKVA